MRTNNIPVSIMAAALATAQLQAFVTPSVALAETMDEAYLNSATSVHRQVTPWASVEGQYPGIVVKVSVQVIATKECSQFWVVDNFLTDELSRQGFTLILEGNEAPQSLPVTSTSTVAVEPRISDDGKTLGFNVKTGLAAGQTAGIQYYLVSPHTMVLGNQDFPLSQWIVEKDNGAFAHFGTVSKSIVIPADPKLNVIVRTGDAYANGNLTVMLDTLGGDQLGNVVIAKKYANALGSQLPTPQRDGYTFQGWFFDSALTQPLQAENIPSYDFTLYAKWAQAEATQTGVLSATTETPEQTKQTTGGAAQGNQANQTNSGTATGRGAGSSSGTKSDLVATGADQTMAVIVASASVMTGLSVLVLRRLQK